MTEQPFSFALNQHALPTQLHLHVLVICTTIKCFLNTIMLVLLDLNAKVQGDRTNNPCDIKQHISTTGLHPHMLVILTHFIQDNFYTYIFWRLNKTLSYSGKENSHFLSVNDHRAYIYKYDLYFFVNIPSYLLVIDARNFYKNIQF